MAKPVLRGHLSFPTQLKATAHFSSLLARTEIGTTLTGEDFADVEALLSGHPRAQEKIGSGVAQIIVDRAEKNEKCFHVIRTDGTKENFSYKKCITGNPPPFTNFSAACRKVVETDLNNFKATHFEKNQNSLEQVLCPETKLWISFTEAHVEHSKLYFSVIVNFFIEANSVDLSKVAYNHEGLYGHEFADLKLAGKFHEWHKKHATLRVIQGTRNLQKAHLGRLKATKADSKLL